MDAYGSRSGGQSSSGTSRGNFSGRPAVIPSHRSPSASGRCTRTAAPAPNIIKCEKSMVGNPRTVIFYTKLPDQQRISVIGPCSFSFATKVMLLLLQKYRTSVTYAFHFFIVRPAVQEEPCPAAGDFVIYTLWRVYDIYADIVQSYIYHIRYTI